jgi:hypothetical protein
MKRPDIDAVRALYNLADGWERAAILEVCNYALYLEGRISDLHLGAEVDDIPLVTEDDVRVAKILAPDIPHKYGEPL